MRLPHCLPLIIKLSPVRTELEFELNGVVLCYEGFYPGTLVFFPLKNQHTYNFFIQIFVVFYRGLKEERLCLP